MKRIKLQFMNSLESWLTPEVEVFSVAEETKGAGGGGPDFGSEISNPT